MNGMLKKDEHGYNWISVKDEKPSIRAGGGYGLIVCDGNKNVRVTYSLVRWGFNGVDYYFDDSHETCAFQKLAGIEPDFDTLLPANAITHWMPVPKPPKESEDDA